jgi:hypothetical protein
MLQLPENIVVPATVYICGPMRGIKNLNFPAFNKAQRTLVKAGFNVISPAENDRLARVPWTKFDEPDFADENWPISKQDLREMLRRDSEWILSLRVEQGDMLVMLPGWRASTGGFSEGAMGRWLHLPLMEIIWDAQDKAHMSRVEESDWGAKASMVADPYFPGRN